MKTISIKCKTTKVIAILSVVCPSLSAIDTFMFLKTNVMLFCKAVGPGYIAADIIIVFSLLRK